MPWFAVDDGFETNPKVRKAGNAAVGLFCRLGAHSTRHGTEGIVPASLARDYGTAAQISKLVTVGMIHQPGHGCDRCPQPPDGYLIMHDFLDYNRSRKEVDAAREAGSERQRRRRARLAEQAAAEKNAHGNDAKSNPNRGPNRTPSEVRNEPHFEDTHAGQDDLSRRDTLENARGLAQPIPSPVPPTEVQLAGPDGVPRIGDRPRIPDASRPLVNALTDAGMVVGWDLQPAEWFLIEALVKRCGIDHLVATATEMWQGARRRPRSGTYFLPGWRALPDGAADAPTEPAPSRLPTLASGPQAPGRPLGVADHNANVLANFRARIHQQEKPA